MSQYHERENDAMVSRSLVTNRIKTAMDYRENYTQLVFSQKKIITRFGIDMLIDFVSPSNLVSSQDILNSEEFDYSSVTF